LEAQQAVDDASKAAAKSSNSLKIFGLSITDPQDILSLLLIAVITLNMGDLLAFYIMKFWHSFN